MNQIKIDFLSKSKTIINKILLSLLISCVFFFPLALASSKVNQIIIPMWIVIFLILATLVRYMKISDWIKTYEINTRLYINGLIILYTVAAFASLSHIDSSFFANYLAQHLTVFLLASFICFGLSNQNEQNMLFRIYKIFFSFLALLIVAVYALYSSASSTNLEYIKEKISIEKESSKKEELLKQFEKIKDDKMSIFKSTPIKNKAESLPKGDNTQVKEFNPIISIVTVLLYIMTNFCLLLFTNEASFCKIKQKKTIKYVKNFKSRIL